MKKLILSIGTLLFLALGTYAQFCYTPNWSEPSLDSMLIYVSHASLDGTNLQSGDAIGVFDGTECVGLGVLSGELTGAPTYLVIEVSLDNPVTLPVDGFSEGSTISYRFCSGGTEVNPAVTPTYITNGPSFVSNDSCIVELRAVNTAPTFTSTEDTDALEDEVYTYTATASDIDGDDLTFSAPVIPDWLLFDVDSQELSGTPDNDDVGFHDVTLRVNDGTVDVDQVFIIEVLNENDAPTFTSLPITTASQDTEYTYTAVAEDVDIGDVLSYGATLLPGWLLFDEDSQILSGTPDNGDVGPHDVTLTVFDGTVTVEQSFIIDVSDENDPPTYTSIPDTVAYEDVPYSSAVTAEDIDGDDITYSDRSLPDWLEFDDETHILSGTPDNDDVGHHDVTLRIDDGTVRVDTSFVIRVTNVNDAPTFTSIPITTATQDSEYTYTAVAEDVDIDDTLRYSATLLPGWLLFDVDTQVLSGTPVNDDVGLHDVTLAVFDGTVTVEQSFTIDVGDENDAPTFTFIPDTVATEDLLYSSVVTAEDIDGDILTFSAPQLPAWLLFDPNTQVLSGTPGNDEVGHHDVTLSIFDGIVTVDSTFSIRVANVNDAPTFASLPDTMALEEVLYLSSVTAEDIDGDSIRFRAPEIPAWLSFNDTTHILTGTPANEDVGDHPVTLRIYDGSVIVDSSFVIHVENVNDAPAFVSMPDTIALEDVLYSSAVTAEDIDGDSIIFRAPLLPAWLSFNDTTHILSGTPIQDDVGDYYVILRISDGTLTVDSSFVITVLNTNDAPTFTSTPITSGLQGSLYSYTVTAEDIDGDTLIFSAPVLPLWLTLDPLTQLLSGTPGNDDVGTHGISLVVNDSTVDVVQSFNIIVEDVNDPPHFTSTPIEEARPGSAYIYTVTAEDIDGDGITFAALVLPGWLTFNTQTHVLSATPGVEDVGDQHVTIRVSDGSLHADQTFVVTVSYGNHAPTFTSDPTISIVVEESYVYSIRAQDIDGDDLSYSAPVLPSWLTFYPATNVVSGIPRSGDLGRHNVTVRVSDGTVSADQTFRITVENLNSAPTFTSTPLISVVEDHLYVYYVTAEDADEDDLSFSAPVLPDWLSFDENSLILHGTPDNADVGDHAVTLMVSDGEDSEDQDFTITVDLEAGVGIADLNTADIMKIYPNPSDGRFIVELAVELEQELSLQIIDPLGRVLMQQEFPPYHQIREEYNLSDRPAGLYFICIYHDSGQSIGKLILQ